MDDDMYDKTDEKLKMLIALIISSPPMTPDEMNAVSELNGTIAEANKRITALIERGDMSSASAVVNETEKYVIELQGIYKVALDRQERLQRRERMKRNARLN